MCIKLIHARMAVAVNQFSKAALTTVHLFERRVHRKLHAYDSTFYPLGPGRTRPRTPAHRATRSRALPACPPPVNQLSTGVAVFPVVELSPSIERPSASHTARPVQNVLRKITGRFTDTSCFGGEHPCFTRLQPGARTRRVSVPGEFCWPDPTSRPEYRPSRSRIPRRGLTVPSLYSSSLPHRLVRLFVAITRDS